MKVRISVDVRFTGTTEIEVPEEEVERYGGPVQYALRGAEDWGQRVWEQGGDVDVEVDGIAVWNEETDQWEWTDDE